MNNKTEKIKNLQKQLMAEKGLSYNSVANKISEEKRQQFLTTVYKNNLYSYQN